MKENYLAKWLNDELSEEELKAFRNTPEFGTYQKIAEAASRLRGPEFDVEGALEQVRKQKQGPQKVISLRPYRTLLRIAAILVVLLGITYYITRSPLQQAGAGYAQRTEIILPDASEVFLNAGSQVSYDKAEWGQDRRVRLHGEAFFRVAKGKTFAVETPAGTVRVLGTEFNVLQREDVFIVSCYEGMVSVEHGGVIRELPAGSGFRLVGGKAEAFGTQGTGPSWMAEESSFRSMPLSFVLEELERQYDLEVTTQGVDTSIDFTGTFSNTNLDLALQSISAPLNLGYSLQGNKVLIYARNAP